MVAIVRNSSARGSEGDGRQGRGSSAGDGARRKRRACKSGLTGTPLRQSAAAKKRARQIAVISTSPGPVKTEPAEKEAGAER